MIRRSESEATFIHERICRGLDLFTAKADEITVEGNVYTVPSCTGKRTYTVTLHDASETCDCPDFQYTNLGACKHTIATLVHHAKGQERVVREVVHEYEPKPFQTRFLGYECGVWKHQLRTSETSPSGYVRVSTRATGEIKTRNVEASDWLRGLPVHRIIAGEEAA